MPGSDLPSAPSRRGLAIQRIGEAILIAVAVGAPWPLAANEPLPEFVLSIGVTLLGCLWAVHAVLLRRIEYRVDLVTAALAGLVLLSAIQTIEFPEGVASILSPARAAWHQEFLPTQGEVLPGEAGRSSRPTSLTLTADPSATRTFLARMLGLLVLNGAARNWLASRAAFRRLGWALALNGGALAVLAIGHVISAPKGVVYWTIPVDGDGAFGPFVCRNHYADYAVLCLGLAGGLLLSQRPTSTGETAGGLEFDARTMSLMGLVALIVLSIPLSQSRGGILAVTLAGAGAGSLYWLGRAHRGRVLRLALVLGPLSLGLVLAASFAGDRLATLLTGEAFAGRLSLWRDVLKLVPGSWLVGTGNGTFVWVEPMARTGGSASVYFENAHNEYLEALLEGGVLRFGLTLLLALGVPIVVARGYWQRRERSIAPLLLGSWFGLTSLIVHAIVDFGIHMPAVAATAAIVVGYTFAAARDPQFIPPRVKVRRVRDGDAVATEAVAPASAWPQEPADRAIKGWMTIPAAVGIVAASLLVAVDAHSRDRVERLKVAAERAFWETGGPERWARRAEYYDARRAIRPDDPEVLFEAAQAHLDAAAAASWMPGAALAGGAAGFHAVPDRMHPALVEQHIRPAIITLRAARAANPLAPKPHTRLALLADYCTSSEPPAIHFARAKRLLPTDPDVWYASGRLALRHGDATTAWEDWRRSLVLSSRHYREILAASRGRLTPSELRVRVLPEEAVLLMQAAELLFPDRASAERREFLTAVSVLPGRVNFTPDQRAAVATALGELDRAEEATVEWTAAIAAAPERSDLRDRFARWLEQEERFDEAIPQLELVVRAHRANEVVRLRLEAAQHAQQLQRVIHGN